MKFGLIVVAALCLVFAGCLPAGSTAAGSALVHQNFPYAVAYEDEQAKSILGEDWNLENYRVERKEADGTIVLERKAGYETTYEFDFDDDDDGDAKQELPYPDLVLLNLKTNARIEVTTLLLDKRRADKELRVLLNDIVDNASGTRSLSIGFGKTTAGVQKRFASRLLDSGEATLGGQKGLVATIERADVDQLQLNPNARWRRSRLFMVKAPFDHQVSEGIDPNFAAKPPHPYRVLLLVEYTNTPEDFEAQYPDFVRLMNRVHLLSDDMLLEHLGQSLAKCGKPANPATLTVTVSSIGVPTVKEGKNLEPMCTTNVVSTYRFAGKGEPREVSQSYDFSKPLKPAWLKAGGYVEERVAAAPPDAAKTDVAKPDAAPAEAAPTPSPAVEAPPSEGGDPEPTPTPSDAPRPAP